MTEDNLIVRNPLHSEAMTLSDIKPGTIANYCDIHRKGLVIQQVIVVGEPFKADKSMSWFANGTWVAWFAYTNERGELAKYLFSLEDMGVVPYGYDRLDNPKSFNARHFLIPGANR